MTEQSTSILDTKSLSKPVSKLIDAISNAIGVVYAPTHIRRMAKANAESEIIKTKSEIDTELLRKRASERIIHVETRRQINIESINEKAFSELPDNVTNEPPDSDWMHDFYNICQDVSDDDLQLLWARILAGEVSTPGSFTVRTMQLLKTLTVREAQLFLLYCSSVLCFKGDNESVYARIIGLETNQIIYNRMSHMDIIHLAELGLVSYKDMKTFVGEAEHQEFKYLKYFHHTFFIKNNFQYHNPLTWFNFMRDKTIEMEFLTELGTELMQVAKGNFNDENITAVRKVLNFSGIKMTEINI